MKEIKLYLVLLFSDLICFLNIAGEGTKNIK